MSSCCWWKQAQWSTTWYQRRNFSKLESFIIQKKRHQRPGKLQQQSWWYLYWTLILPLQDLRLSGLIFKNSWPVMSTNNYILADDPVLRQTRLDLEYYLEDITEKRRNLGEIRNFVGDANFWKILDNSFSTGTHLKKSLKKKNTRKLN